MTGALTCAFALACAAALLASPASAADKGSRTHALIVKQAHSPVLGALKHRLDRKLDLDRTPPRGDKRSKHDLLIVDGDALSARRMARRRELRQFSNSGRWVLALDVGSKHHHRALAKHTGFEALAQGKHKSRAFLFRHAVVDGVPREIMLDSERLIPTGSEDVAKKQRRKSKRREAKRVASLIAERVRADDDELAGIAGVEEGAPGGEEAPPEALTVGWSYDVPGTVQPRDGHRSSGHGIPPPGHQESEWTMHHNFTVYLDNSKIHPRGDFQTVTYDFSGSFNPAREGTKFFQMFDLERAWWTGMFDSSVTPDAATAGKVTFDKSQPQTENQKREVSSGDGFDISIAASKEGPAIDGSYHVTHGKDFTIPDWGLINTSTAGAGRAAWQFSSRHPCDPRPEASPPPEDNGNCFQTHIPLSDFYPSVPNELSQHQITVDTSARWHTNKLLEPGNGNLSFTVDTPVTLVDLYCGDITDPTGCGNHVVDRQRVGPAAKTYSFDASDALPVPIESLDLDAKTANGKANQVVHGTVKLERRVPFDTTILVFSNKENAFLETSVDDQVSKEAITIPKGSDTGKFDVHTNANGIHAGQSVTAYITAFYGGASAPVGLDVNRGSQ